MTDFPNRALSGGGSYNPSDEEIHESTGNTGNGSYMDYMDADFTSASDYAEWTLGAAAIALLQRKGQQEGSENDVICYAGICADFSDLLSNTKPAKLISQQIVPLFPVILKSNLRYTVGCSVLIMEPG
jgi:hypothetical protein